MRDGSIHFPVISIQMIFKARGLDVMQIEQRTRNLGSSKRDGVAHLPESSGFIHSVVCK